MCSSSKRCSGLEAELPLSSDLFSPWPDWSSTPSSCWRRMRSACASKCCRHWGRWWQKNGATGRRYIYTCCFHHPPVAVPKTHPHVRWSTANLSGYSVSTPTATNYWKAWAQNALNSKKGSLFDPWFRMSHNKSTRPCLEVLDLHNQQRLLDYFSPLSKKQQTNVLTRFIDTHAFKLRPETFNTTSTGY